MIVHRGIDDLVEGEFEYEVPALIAGAPDLDDDLLTTEDEDARDRIVTAVIVAAGEQTARRSTGTMPHPRC